MIQWHAKSFTALSTRELYQFLKLRVDVFVVEQHCPYPELDGYDHHDKLIHLMGWQDDVLCCYARILPPGLTFDTPSIGRVIVSATARGGQLGRTLMQQAITICQTSWPKHAITIGAQAHLQRFYQSLGFTPISDIYLEDGIPHLDMQLG
ncbi:GNAT family N-acetyltransferase [Celerinatantimonas yamalensis]|uniref:GNAT family N-acetyltransferase n=1 Tax=Celerinatantimonas yamalensis TaxID=559956 RepID=A0ABW9G972_9GAMM